MEIMKCPNCGLETDNDVIMKWHSCEGVLLNKALEEHKEDV